MLKDEAHGGRSLFVNDILLVLVGGQAQRTATVDSLPFQCAFAHTAAHLLCQLCGVVFGKGFHQTFNDNALCALHVAFGSIKNLDAVVPQTLLVHGTVVPVAGKAVCFPADHHIKRALVAVVHHLLERGAVVGLTGDMPVNVFVKDGQAVELGVILAVPALPFDALLCLPAAAGVAVVGNKAVAVLDFLLSHI